MIKLNKIRRSAHGEDCTLRIPFCCNYDPTTTVLAHVGKGSDKRHDDTNAVYACHACHDAIDRRSNVFLCMYHDDHRQDMLNDEREQYIARALDRTRDKLRAKGLMK